MYSVSSGNVWQLLFRHWSSCLCNETTLQHVKSTSMVCSTCFWKKGMGLKIQIGSLRALKVEKQTVWWNSKSVSLISAFISNDSSGKEDCNCHLEATFPPHVQNLLFLTVVYLFLSPLSTDRCSFRRSSSFVCLRHGRRTTEALCLTSIRSATPALNFRWDSTFPLNSEFAVIFVWKKKKQLLRLIRIAYSRVFAMNSTVHWILFVMSLVHSVSMVSFDVSDRRCKNILHLHIFIWRRRSEFTAPRWLSGINI